MEMMNDLELRQWESDAAASAEATPASEETTPAEPKPTQDASELERRLEELEKKLQEVDWAFRINTIAQQNPQLAAELLHKAAEVYAGHAQQPQQTTPTVDVAQWFQQLEALVNSPPVDPEWMSEEAKWMHQVARTIVEGLKASYQASQQYWQQLLQQQEEVQLAEAEEAAIARVESEIQTLKERMGPLWSEEIEEKVLSLMEKVAEEEDRLIFPLEAYGLLVAQGAVPPPPPARRVTTGRPTPLHTVRSAPGASVQPRQRPASIDDAVKQTFAEFGITLE